MDSTYPLVPIANFLACILVLASVPKSMSKSMNVGVFSLAIWVAIESFITAVNSIIWADNVENVAPVWCDITTHLDIGSIAAIPAASLVIVRRLSLIMRPYNSVLIEKRKLGFLFDLFICIGIPIIQMTLYYIVQSNRFSIVEELGCSDGVDNAGLSFVLTNSLGIVIPLLSLVLYSPRTIYMCFKHRRELNELLASNSNLDRGSFFKIMALGIFDILLTLPVGVFDLVLEILEGDIPTFWSGWRASHSEFSSIPTVTAIEWKSGGFGAVSSIIISQWSNPLYAIVFFTLFGLTEKNRQWYANLFWKILEPFGCKPRQNPVVSDIVFHSTPVHPGFDVSRAGTTITRINQSPSPETMDRRTSFNNPSDTEEARDNDDFFGTQTMVVSQSISEAAIKE